MTWSKHHDHCEQ